MLKRSGPEPLKHSFQPQKTRKTLVFQCQMKPGDGERSFLKISHLNSLSTALYSFFKGSRGLLEPIPVISLGEGRVHCGRVASSSQGPYWWLRPPRKVPTAHQEQFWGSVSCSSMQHAAQFRPRGARIQTSNLPITSRPALPAELQPPLSKDNKHI